MPRSLTHRNCKIGSVCCFNCKFGYKLGIICYTAIDNEPMTRMPFLQMRKLKLREVKQTYLHYTADSSSHIHAHYGLSAASRDLNSISPFLHQPLRHSPSLPVLQAVGLTALPGLIPSLAPVFFLFVHLLFVFSGVLASTFSFSHPFLPCLPFSRPL